MSPSRHNPRSPLGQNPRGRHPGGLSDMLCSWAGLLLTTWVCVGCTAGPNSSHVHLSNESSRLRPAVIQHDLKTRLRHPFDSAKPHSAEQTEGSPVEHSVRQVSWLDDRPDQTPRTSDSSRRTARSASGEATVQPTILEESAGTNRRVGREPIRSRIPILMPAARRQPQPQLQPMARPPSQQSGKFSSRESDPASPVPTRSVQPSTTLRSPPNPVWNPAPKSPSRSVPQRVPVDSQPVPVDSQRVPVASQPNQSQETPARNRDKPLEGTAIDSPWVQIARYLWQPPSPRPPRELPELPEERVANGLPGPNDVVDSPIVFRSLSQIDTHISPPTGVEQEGEQPYLPEDRAAEYFSQFEPYFYRSEGYRPWDAYAAVQITQAFCHRPLYFEEINVERFGRSAGILQPAVSAARFFATVPTLPYRMAIDHPAVCQVDPSPYPPGTSAPRHRQAPPLRVRAALIQAVAVVGIIAIFP
jgi:hypothetical protein